jgi:aprataxin
MSQPLKKTWWKLGLLEAMKDPELKVYSDEELIVIRDCFPKSEKHFLVLPLEDIKDLRSLTKEHLDIVQAMEEKGFEMGRLHFEGRKFK